MIALLLLVGAWQVAGQETKVCQFELTAAMVKRAFGACGVEDSQAPGQGITCEAAFPHIKDGIAIYNLTRRAQAAFYIGTMGYESGNLTYNKPIKGDAGQGTRSMLQAANLHAFLNDSSNILEKEPALKAIAVKEFKDVSDDEKGKMLEILNRDDYSFLPGAWWIRQGAEKMLRGSCQGFAAQLEKRPSPEQLEKTIRSCIGVEPIPARVDAFKRAFNAIKCSNNEPPSDESAAEPETPAGTGEETEKKPEPVEEEAEKKAPVEEEKETDEKEPEKEPEEKKETDEKEPEEEKPAEEKKPEDK